MADLTKTADIKEVGREERQHLMGHFVKTRFGHAVFRNKRQNAARVLNDAVELIKLSGISELEAQALMHNIYVKPYNGETEEAVIGSVGAAILAFADCCGLSADRCENNQLLKLLSIPMGYFKKQQRQAQAQEFDAKEPKLPGEDPIAEEPESEKPKKVTRKPRKPKMH